MDTLKASLAGQFDDEVDDVAGEQSRSSYLDAMMRLDALLDQSLLLSGQPTKRTKVVTTITHIEDTATRT